MAEIRINGRMVNAIRITLETNDHDVIRQQLTKILHNPSTTGALVVLESTVEQELISLIQLLLDLDVQPMAVQDGLLTAQARAIQFPVISGQGHTPGSPLQEVKATKEQVVETPLPAVQHEPDTQATSHSIRHVTSYHDEILRTGQCLVQHQGDIILTAGINSGSEIIASGNIHIYGSARGRVIAGAGGNNAARIFCHALEAELVSIAGTYCVADDIPAQYLKRPTHIYLNDQQELVFEALEF